VTVSSPTLLLVLDLAGTFVFAIDGALIALRARVAEFDIVGVLALALITALGGGIVRDVLIGAVPPATFSDWRYIAVAVAGGLLAFVAARQLDRVAPAIRVLDAAGLSLFAVTGASKALGVGIGPVQAVILGAVTAVGGGILRDALTGQVPAVLHVGGGLLAIPALLGATIVVVTSHAGLYGVVAALAAASACFLLRMLGVSFGLRAPRAPTIE
jgi:uncharacterized membrane protein YeiH